MHARNPRLSNRLALIALLTALAVSGCGEAGMFSRGELREATEANAGSTLDGADVTVEQLSARCDDDESTCPKGAGPNVEVHIESRSVIFDFSNITDAGRFPRSEFEGFVIEVPTDRPVLFAQINPESTNLEIEDSALEYGDDFIELDFAGVEFDETGFVEIQLLVGPLKLIGRGE